MSNSYKAASSAGVAALVLSGAAMAAAPTPFDGWSVTGGNVTTSVACPSGFSCASAVTGDGFFQRQITDNSSGASYFQTIITDRGATGTPGAGTGLAFSDESFVQTGNVGGLADKSAIQDSTTTTDGFLTETFGANTQVLTGWAGENGNDQVLINQFAIAEDTGEGAEDFRTDFWLEQTGQEGSIGRNMRITSEVDILEATSTTEAQVQKFILSDLSGGNVDAPGSVVIGGTTVEWLPGENIKAIFVGQNMSDIVGVNQEFGYTSYENVTAADMFGFEFSLNAGSSETPTNWDTGVWGSLATDGTGGPF